MALAEEARAEAIPDGAHNDAISAVERDIFASGKQIKQSEKVTDPPQM